MSYDAERTRAYFDAFAEREWERLEKSLQHRVKYAVHRRLLDEYVTEGMRVLDIGSGPGRFAIDLATMGARVTVADLSPVQLDLARQRLSERALLDRVDDFRELDVLDLATLGESFDAVVCYGAVISYTRERHADAIRAIAQVLAPGGVALVSVINTLGYMRMAGIVDVVSILERLDEHVERDKLMNVSDVVYSRLPSREFHQPMVLFTARGLRAALVAGGLEVVDMATSNPLFPEFLPMPRIAGSERAAAEDRKSTRLN